MLHLQTVKLELLNKLVAAIGKNKVKSIYGSFENELCNCSRELLSALMERNFDDINRHAHSMKSSALIFGAEKFSIIMRDIEVASKDEESEKLADLIISIDPVSRDTVAELRSCLRKL